MANLKAAVLISGRGSNMKALAAACNEPGFPAEVVLVISNNSDTPGLKYAKEA